MELREQLAELVHRQWSEWMIYVFEKCTPRDNGEYIIPKWAVNRWERQVATPYSELSEDEKDSDRTEADRVLALLKQLELSL